MEGPARRPSAEIAIRPEERRFDPRITQTRSAGRATDQPICRTFLKSLRPPLVSELQPGERSLGLSGGDCSHDAATVARIDYATWPICRHFLERMMGLEPTTFCMASRRSSQLSYIREASS